MGDCVDYSLFILKVEVRMITFAALKFIISPQNADQKLGPSVDGYEKALHRGRAAPG